ncbi:43365_t:CDS:2 [Gigaspora margarita]|uniref:43365_t:CDS:1 n=1 Tax=Gigaspora margarita TaxID=4874 RepID=A0ABN7VH82_GIGMA|nr:43365_t:CDS:2 [Gigaspora margarita]
MDIIVKIADKINNSEYEKSETIREKLGHMTNTIRIMKEIKETKIHIKYRKRIKEDKKSITYRMEIQLEKKNNAEWKILKRIQKLEAFKEIDGRLLARNTLLKDSIMKTFKVKMMISKLPTLLNIYYRDTKKNPDPICSRCVKAIENQKHWIECEANNYKLEDMIKEILTKMKEEKQLTKEEINEVTKK